MNIAVNTRLLLPNRLEGIGWFAHELLRRIVRNHPEHTFHFFFDRPYDPSFLFAENVVPHVLFPPARHPVLWYWWFEWAVAQKIRVLRPALFFSPEAYLALRSQVPTIMTVHDLSLLHYPQHVGWANRKYVQYFYPRFISRADHIVTVSSYSRKDLIGFFPAAEEKISVVHNGAREEYQPVDSLTQQDTRQRYTNGAPYFLYVGALQPRKNIERLLLAFDQFKAETNAPHQLLLVGRKAWMTAAIEQTYRQLHFRQSVHFLDYQPLEVVAELMAAAHALTYVSLFEGFGIPILEALQSGVPVLTANTTSMPEVAGDAGICVDPLSIPAIVDGLVQLAQEETVYRACQAHTLSQAAKFTWDQSATDLWAVFQAVRDQGQ